MPDPGAYTNSDIWLVLLMQQYPAPSPSAYDISDWHSHTLNGENWQQEAQAGYREEERGIPDRHYRDVELPLWVSVCSLHTCQSVELLANSLVSEKATLE